MIDLRTANDVLTNGHVWGHHDALHGWIVGLTGYVLEAYEANAGDLHEWGSDGRAFDAALHEQIDYQIADLAKELHRRLALDIAELRKRIPEHHDRDDDLPDAP